MLSEAFKDFMNFIKEFKDLKRKDNPCSYHRHGCEKMKQVYEKVVRRILDIELKRGDSPTPVSEFAMRLERIEGMDILVVLLKAMGKDTFDRTGHHYNSDFTKKRSALPFASNLSPGGR